MPNPSQEERIVLAIKAARDLSKKNSLRSIAKAYNVPESTLRHRIKGRVPRREIRNPAHKLNALEEEVLREYIIDLDARGMPPNIAGVEDMANLLTASRGGERVGKHWVRRFIDRNPDLKPRMNRRYDYQRALCEDPDVVFGWFGLVANSQSQIRYRRRRHVQFRRDRLYDGHDRINPRRNTRRPAWEGQVGPAWQSGMVNGN
ncbi:uncharacterized protein PG998_014219 [Apiospora kogelbergensis]|uniref:uncharacterized protein n=1 Tax=Apiospora kogelbergensis TaxID=1337665 RepID=UPI00312F4F0F